MLHGSSILCKALSKKYIWLKVLPRIAFWVSWSWSSRCINSSWYRISILLFITDFISLSFTQLNQLVKVRAAASRTSREASSKRFRTSAKEQIYNQSSLLTEKLSFYFYFKAQIYFVITEIVVAFIYVTSFCLLNLWNTCIFFLKACIGLLLDCFLKVNYVVKILKYIYEII